MAPVLLTLIRAYQRFVSPSLGIACRYEPTCSHYAAEAIERHGAWRGLRLTARRLSRCRPGGGSGYDPVPGAPPSESQTHPTTVRPERHAGADAPDMRPAR